MVRIISTQNLGLDLGGESAEGVVYDNHYYPSSVPIPAKPSTPTPVKLGTSLMKKPAGSPGLKDK